MKTTLLILTAFIFVAMQFAIAQDPTISIPTEQSEAAAAEASPTPNRSTSDAPKKSASPKPASSPVVAITATASPAPTPAKKMGAEATVRELESKWVASVATHDPAVAQQVLADDYAGISARGRIMNKRALLAQIKKDTDTYSSAKVGKMDVRLFGNTAVVIGASNENGKDSRGSAFNRAYRWTDTWVLRNDKWQCVASQSMQVPR